VTVAGPVAKVEPELEFNRVDRRVEVLLEVLEAVEEFVAAARPLRLERRIELACSLLVWADAAPIAKSIAVRPWVRSSRAAFCSFAVAIRL